jgi:GntR family transcriptional regulator
METRDEQDSAGVVATYLCVADELQRYIETAPAGERLPSEHELAARYDISRVTARAVLQELERRHLVRRARGSGTFVARRIDFPITSDAPPSWSEAVRRGGGVPETKVVGVKLIRAQADVREHLELGPSATVVELRRLGFVDGILATFVQTYLPSTLSPDLRERVSFGGSLYQTMHVLGLEPVRLWSAAELEIAPADIASILKLEGRPPIWRTEGCVIDVPSGRKIEYGIGWSRPDVFRYRFELWNRPAAQRDAR